MHNTVKTWLIELLEKEIEESHEAILNICLMAHHSKTEEEAEMLTKDVGYFEEYMRVLKTLKEQVEEDKLDV